MQIVELNLIILYFHLEKHKKLVKLSIIVGHKKEF